MPMSARATGIARSLISAVAALALVGAAAAQPVGDFAGTWRFVISGDDDGKGTAVVDSQGRIKGVGASSKSPLPLTLSGQIDGSGTAQFTAAPGGMTSTGATFEGKLDASGQGSGTWQNAAYGMAGTWRATRESATQEELPTQQTFDCEIDGQASQNVEARADLFRDTRNNKSDFRVISILPEIYSMDVKARGVTGPGAAPIVNEPGWRTSLRINRKSDRMEGTWTFKTFDVAAKRVEGTVAFSSGAHRGTCRFKLFLFVADFSNLPIPR